MFYSTSFEMLISPRHPIMCCHVSSPSLSRMCFIGLCCAEAFVKAKTRSTTWLHAKDHMGLCEGSISSGLLGLDNRHDDKVGRDPPKR
jgi:hypothetical protein